MKKAKILICLFLLFAISATVSLPNVTATLAQNRSNFVPGEVIVGFEEMSINSLEAIRVNGGVVTQQISQLNAVVVKVGNGRENDFIQTMKKNPNVKYTERNGIVQATYIPNDPSWNLLWNMPKIKADKAWDTYRGYKTVIIAILDTGVDYNHPDLAANYMPGGYDWVNDDFDPIDDHYHGTHCAGIAAAVMDNSVGVVGVGQCKIWAEKVLNSGGSGSWDDLANAIIHVTDKKVNIISMSLGGYGYSSLVESACAYAYNRGVLLVAAAGNDNTNIDTNPFYPACYSTVIAVSSTDSSDAKSTFSNYGNAVEVAAPGTSIYSTLPSNSYGNLSGTSMSTPHVAGLLGLMWSFKPTQFNIELRDKLHSAVDDLGTPGKDIYFGYGRINCKKPVSSPESYSYRFRLSPYIDRAWVNVVAQTGGNLIYGKLNLTYIDSGYPAPILGWATGDDFYMSFDFRTAPGYYELGFLVGKISTRSGKLYRTSDGTTWIGPTSITLVPFTTETTEDQGSGLSMATVIEPEAISYVEGFNTGGTPTNYTYIGGWYGIPYTPSVTYPLKKVELMAGGGTGTFIVQLRTDNGSGYPSTTILRHVAFTMSNTRTWQGAEFDTAYKVTAGVQYWIVFQPVAGSLCSIATNGTHITHVWDNLVDGTMDWDYKGTVYPWMIKFYREVQAKFSYRFTLSPFIDKVYVNVASQTGGSLIYGLANTTTSHIIYPAPVLGWATGDNFYMTLDFRTTTGSASYELAFIVGKISTRTGKLYRTRFGPDWTGPTSVTLVPFAQQIESATKLSSAYD